MTPWSERLDRLVTERPRRAAGWLFALALLVQLLYLSQYATTPFFWEPRLDGLFHDRAARELAAGKAPALAYFRAPLYTYLLGGVYFLFGHSLWAARLVQALIESGSVVLLFLLGRRAFRPAVGLLAAAAMALYGPLVYNALELHTPVLEVFLLLAALLALLCATKTPGFFLTGLLIGLGALARPNGLVLAPLALLWLLATRRFRPAAALLVGALLLPLAVTARNIVVASDPVFIASQGGINLFIGNRPEADGFTPSTPTRYRFESEYEDSVALYGQRAAEEALGRKLTQAESSRYWTGRALAFWREEPLSALALLGKKLLLNIGAREVRNNTSFDYIRREWVPLLWLAPLGFGLVGPLGLWGMLAGKKTSEQRLLIALIVVHTLSHAVFFAADRYRLPCIPLVLLFAAHGLAMLRLSPRPLCILAALALLVNIEWVKTGGPRTLALDEASAASRLLARGDASGAEERARKAVALDGASAELHSHLGSALYGQGRFQEAAEAFARAASLAPQNPADCYNAAVCLKALGRAGDAHRLLQEALRRDPGYSRARESLPPDLR